MCATRPSLPELSIWKYFLPTLFDKSPFPYPPLFGKKLPTPNSQSYLLHTNIKLEKKWSHSTGRQMRWPESVFTGSASDPAMKRCIETKTSGFQDWLAEPTLSVHSAGYIRFCYVTSSLYDSWCNTCTYYMDWQLCLCNLCIFQQCFFKTVYSIYAIIYFLTH